MKQEEVPDFLEVNSDKDSSKSNNQNKQFKKNNFMQFAGMGVQMAAVIGMGAYGGYLLDEKYQTEKAYWTAGLALFGVLISLYLLIKKANSMSNEK